MIDLVVGLYRQYGWKFVAALVIYQILHGIALWLVFACLKNGAVF